jgi:wobble nucleotide-excising tRNase
MQTSELLKVMKESVEFLKDPAVTQTSVGIQAYIQGNLLQRQIDALEKEIEEENAYIDMMAERLGY